MQIRGSQLSMKGYSMVELRLQKKAAVNFLTAAERDWRNFSLLVFFQFLEQL